MFRTPSLELVSTAYHEAGHAIAITMAFRTAKWLPYPPPLPPVKFVEIIDHGSGRLGGNCFGADIYSVRWPVKSIAEPFRDLMESQVVIELAGGIAEACHRGERRRRAILAFAESHCAIDADLERAAAVLGDLFRLTGVRYDAQPFAERALALLSANWCAVTALASALVEDRRIEGDRVEAIIDAA